MIFILVVLIGLTMVAGGLVIRRKAGYFSDGAGALFGVGLVIVLIISIVTLSVYVNNLGRIAEMQAFHDETATAYKQAIVEANNAAIVTGHSPKGKLAVLEAVSAASLDGLINLDNFSQSSNITELIKDYRNGIRNYNAKLAKYQAYRRSILIWPMMPKIPKHLKLMSY